MVYKENPEKQILPVKMTPEEKAIIEEKLKEVAEILYKNTHEEELDTFETIEMSVREHLLDTVAPTIGNFFLTRQEGKKLGEKEK
jgi:hypothetical protein